MTRPTSGVLFAVLALSLLTLTFAQSLDLTNILRLQKRQQQKTFSSSCFSCSQTPISHSYSATSCQSSDDACRLARQFLYLSAEQTCSGLGCSKEEQSSASLSTCRGESPQNLTACRQRVISTSECGCASGTGWMCSISCDSNCQCGPSTNFSFAGNEDLSGVDVSSQLSTAFAFGLTHVALGSATFTAANFTNDDKNTEFLFAENLGASGNDGYSIALNSQNVASIDMSIYLNKSQASASAEFIPSANLSSGSDRQIWNLLVNATEKNTWNVSLLQRDVTFSRMRVELRLKGRIVFAQNISMSDLTGSQILAIPSGEWIVTPSLPVDTQLWAMMTFRRSVSIQLLFTKSQCSAAVIDNNDRLLLPLQTNLKSCGANNIVADQFILAALDPSEIPANLSSFTALASNLTHISIFKETLALNTDSQNSQPQTRRKAVSRVQQAQPRRRLRVKNAQPQQQQEQPQPIQAQEEKQEERSVWSRIFRFF